MDLQPQLIFELAALGICTGFLAGLLGIGGGMVMVPFLTFMLTHRGVDADLAVKMGKSFDGRAPRTSITSARALVGGYESRRPLSDAERAALPILSRSSARCVLGSLQNKPRRDFYAGQR